METTGIDPMRISRRARVAAAWLAVVLATALCGCATKIGTKDVGFQRAYNQINTNALLEDRFSAISANVLHRYNIGESFDEEPLDALRFLQEKVRVDNRRDLLFAIAELSYYLAEAESRDPNPEKIRRAKKCWLSAAVHAWFFLFDENRGPCPDPFDRLFRLACDLYNIGLAKAMTGDDGNLEILEGPRELTVGAMELSVSMKTFSREPETFEKIIAADRLEIRGLSRRNRNAGLGVPFVAVESGAGRTPYGRAIPGTLFLRIENTPEEFGSAAFKGALECYSPFMNTETRVDDRRIPLECDTSVQVAYMLNQELLWDLGFREFLTGRTRIAKGLHLSMGPQRGRIPVVFVHGTLSSPVWWAEMVNTLRADPVLGRRYQFWFYFYDSGKPIVFSGSEFRETVKRKVEELDPKGADEALRRMVIVGHSQGGLLAKLAAVDTGEKLIEALTGKGLEELDISPKSREIIRSYAIIEPLPFVRRVVFIATPHRGSFLVGKWVRRLVSRIVSLPADIMSMTGRMLSIARELDLGMELEDLGTLTSIDSMSPNNKALLALAEIPLGPGVEGHSIIAVDGDGDPRQGDDGVVEYQSAHVDWAASELIVPSGHSCQDHPFTIEEVRRILLLHLEKPGSGT